MTLFENNFVSRKAAEAEARIAAEKERRAQVWKQIQQEEPGLAEFIQETARVFGKPADTKIDLSGETVVAATGVFLNNALKPVRNVRKKLVRFCHECKHWERDTVGDGTGLGNCTVVEHRFTWPGDAECSDFEER